MQTKVVAVIAEKPSEFIAWAHEHAGTPCHWIGHPDDLYFCKWDSVVILGNAIMNPDKLAWYKEIKEAL
jgi:hypothetical protein